MKFLNLTHTNLIEKSSSKKSSQGRWGRRGKEGELFLDELFSIKFVWVRLRNFMFLEVLGGSSSLVIKILSKYEITRLDRIKKIDAHKNVTITTEKYIKLQEF
jgi:hypothetical protein